MVFPSEWAEPFGLVPVEAMACDTPVIATRVGGSAEFLHAGVNCLAFPAGDHEALAVKVRQLADDTALRQRLVAAGRATVEVLDVERLADVMEAWHVYEASGRTGPPPARRLGVPPASAAAMSLRLIGDRRAVVEGGASEAGSVRVDPRALPVRTGRLIAVHLRTEGHDVATDLRSITNELARVVEAGGSLLIQAPNPSDLRLVRSRVQARWRGWRRRLQARGAVELSLATRLLSIHGTVVRSDTGTWDSTGLGRAMGKVLRVARISSYGPRTEVEVRRR
jgi:hypothetical protein